MIFGILIIMKVCVDLSGFILLGLSTRPWSCMYVSFTTLRKFSTIFLQLEFQSLVLFSFWYPFDDMLDIVPKFPILISFFKYYFFPFAVLIVFHYFVFQVYDLVLFFVLPVVDSNLFLILIIVFFSYTVFLC